MRRVDAHLERLQPVAVPQALEGKAVRGRRGKAVEARGRAGGDASFGPEPAEQHAGLLQQRVAALLDALAQRAAGGLGRVCPGSGRAASNFQPWKGQRRPSPSLRPKARSAPRCGQSRSSRPKLPSALLEQHEVLPQQAHRLHRAHAHGRVQRGVEFIHQRHRLPVAAHQVAAGRARANAGDQFVLFGFHGGLSSRRLAEGSVDGSCTF